MEARSGSLSSNWVRNRIDLIGWSLFIGLSVLVLPFFLIVFAQSESLHGGMDSYNHYLIAKYSWEHPKLLLDQWGKPIFTLIASVFAQRGLAGMIVLNSMCLIGSAWLVAAAARHLKLAMPWLAGIIMITSPLFTDHIISGLTEPLNALFLSFVFYLLIREDYKTAAVIAGLLPFVRSEGFVLLLPIFLYFLVKGKFSSFIWIILPALVFNLMGWVILDAPFWIFSHNPYIKFQVSGEVICGSGSFWHYLRYFPPAFGIIPSILATGGFFYWSNQGLRAPKNPKVLLNVLLLSGTAGLFTFVHSFIWWQGMMGSCGYIRVLIIISPAIALLSYQMLVWLMEKLKGNLNVVILASLIALLTYAPFKYFAHRYPVEKSHEQVAFEKVHAYLEQEELLNRKMFFLYPYLNILNKSDPYDWDEHTDLWSYHPDYIQPGDIVIWDSHFGPNEASLEVKTFTDDPDFNQLFYTKTYHPDPKLRDRPMEVYVFEYRPE
jgi:hypothetical protein